MLFILLCLLLPSYHTHSYPPEVYRLFLGDLGLDDLYLPEMTDEVISETEMKDISKLDVRELLRDAYVADNPQEIYPEVQNITANSEDAKEYNDISTMVYNFTRKRVFSQYWGMWDYVDSWWHGEKIEDKKMRMFEKICLMYLYHARYKIELAFKQRDPLRNDKRYKLGYLFNRLRRLKTEMLKLVAIGKRQLSFGYWKTYENLTGFMRLYERVVHIDVDIRDTVELVGVVFSEPAYYDVIRPKVKGGDSKTRRAGKTRPPEDHMKNNSTRSVGDDFMQEFEKLLTGG